MLTFDRHRYILDKLSQNGRVTTYELCTELNASPSTIRNDLNKLETDNLLQKIYGGAISLNKEIKSPNVSAIFNFNQRSAINKPEKEAICNTALQYIQEGQCIILDASSTCLALANSLGNFSRLTVVTNGIHTMMALKEFPNITVILIGGIVTKNSGSIEGSLGIDLIKNIHADIAFVSAHGFSLNEGLTDFNFYEAELKRHMFYRARRKIALLDYSKLDNISTASFGDTKDIDLIISDSKAMESTVLNYRNTGIQVQIAE